MSAFLSATIDVSGTQISYVDSGPVPNSNDYITFVCYHGILFNRGTTFLRLPFHRVSLIKFFSIAEIFARLLPQAISHYLRIVLLDRRGYGGSTTYSESEVESLKLGHKEFLQTMGRQVAEFLVYFLERNEIPHASADGYSGGIVLIGWSIGAVWALSLLAHSEIPTNYLKKLQPYVKNVVLVGSHLRLHFLDLSLKYTCSFVDAPHKALGFPAPVLKK
jgi:pimeloyl-ACP methyl ester carboxylesterase